MAATDTPAAPGSAAWGEAIVTLERAPVIHRGIPCRARLRPPSRTSERDPGSPRNRTLAGAPFLYDLTPGSRPGRRGADLPEWEIVERVDPVEDARELGTHLPEETREMPPGFLTGWRPASRLHGPEAA